MRWEWEKFSSLSLTFRKNVIITTSFRLIEHVIRWLTPKRMGSEPLSLIQQQTVHYRLYKLQVIVGPTDPDNEIDSWVWTYYRHVHQASRTSISSRFIVWPWALDGPMDPRLETLTMRWMVFKARGPKVKCVGGVGRSLTWVIPSAFKLFAPGTGCSQFTRLMESVTPSQFEWAFDLCCVGVGLDYSGQGFYNCFRVWITPDYTTVVQVYCIINIIDKFLHDFWSIIIW